MTQGLNLQSKRVRHDLATNNTTCFGNLRKLRLRKSQGWGGREVKSSTCPEAHRNSSELGAEPGFQLPISFSPIMVILGWCQISHIPACS